MCEYQMITLFSNGIGIHGAFGGQHSRRSTNHQ
jgi:hypothetical protein